jgi:hypothetical protein
MVDRYGKRRCYYRRDGRTVAITADPIRQAGLFRKQYEAARDGTAMPDEDEGPAPSGYKIGTWNRAIDDYLDTAKYAEKADNTKKAYREFIGLLRATCGDEMMRKTPAWAIFKLHDNVVKSGRKAQANTFLSVLAAVVKIGRLRGWVKDDLLGGLDHQEIESNSHRPYSDDEVAMWRAAYPVGTMARAAFEFAYQFALSRAELIVLSPAHITDGVLWITRMKTGTPQTANVFADPVMADVLAAFADDGAVVDLQGRSPLPFLRNQYGKPFQSSTFGKQWRRWAIDAGLPADFTIHAARSTFVTDAMDTGVANQDAMKVTGHLDERVFTRVYGKKHNKTRAAVRAQAGVLAERRKRSAVALREVA